MRRRRIVLRPRLGAVALLAVVVVAAAAWLARAPASTDPGRRAPSSRLPDPRAAASQPPPALPVALSGLALAASGGRLWVVGGLVGGTTSTAAVYSWRPGEPAWKLVARLPAARHDGAAAAVGRGVWFAGGGLGSVSAADAEAVGAVARGARVGVRPLPALPEVRSDLAAVAWQGGMVVAGGYDGLTDSLDVLSLSPGATAWRTRAVLPAGMRYAAAAALADRLYLFGGLTPAGLSDAIWRVDLVTGGVRRVGTLPEAADYMAAAVVRGRIFVLGGATAAGDLSTVWRFDPASGRLAPAGQLPGGRAYGAAAALAGRVYYVGGESAGRALAQVVALRPSGA